MKARMPGEIRAVQWIMWIQTVLGALEILLVLAVLFMSGMPGFGSLPWFFYPVIAPLVLMGPLSIGFRSRRQWVRRASIGVEGVSILEHGYSMFLMLGVSIPALINTVLAVIAVAILFGTGATRWFER
ncbi:hypothetical protein [Streptosporangium sp. NPDC087985]|uniref:hypothetical protein n=1 Tax=Streptosporangium sp. NPDC087985 TaxID=3366196 RepID=UPI00382C9C60